MLDQVINKIKALAELNERAEKAAVAKNAVEGLAASKAWRDSVRSFTHKIRNRKDEAHVTLRLSNYKKAKSFIHSSLGGNTLVDDAYVLSQIAESDIRNGRRWIDLLPERRHDSLVNIQRYHLTTTGSPADFVNEGDPKPLREKVQNVVTYQLRKLAVTDLVTQEAIYALPNDRYLDFLIDAHFEHVLDRLEQEVTNEIAASANLFNPATYSGYLTTNNNQATWHDLISAAQRDYESLFQEHFSGAKFANLFITGRRTIYGILNDRNGFGRDYLAEEHDVNRFVLTDNMFWWSRSMETATHDNALLLNTDAFELHVLDAVDTYFERVVDSSDERNLYRIVAEVYFAVVPRYRSESLGNPAIFISNTLSTRNNL